MDITVEKSEAAAIAVKKIKEILPSMHVEYLKEGLRQLKAELSRKESMSILSPQPYTVHARLDVDQLRLKSLELMIQLAENELQILEAEIRLSGLEEKAISMNKIFEGL